MSIGWMDGCHRGLQGEGARSFSRCVGRHGDNVDIGNNALYYILEGTTTITLPWNQPLWSSGYILLEAATHSLSLPSCFLLIPGIYCEGSVHKYVEAWEKIISYDIVARSSSSLS